MLLANLTRGTFGSRAPLLVDRCSLQSIRFNEFPRSSESQTGFGFEDLRNLCFLENDESSHSSGQGTELGTGDKDNEDGSYRNTFGGEYAILTNERNSEDGAPLNNCNVCLPRADRDLASDLLCLDCSLKEQILAC
jgi:hypothetical protein